ncbi:MAG: hypothetical protein Q9181_000537 [Wetmoreana brouardii]
MPASSHSPTLTAAAANTSYTGQCVHKLPTSCQLTAQPVCCACGDKRPQASSFNRYIDGVGFTLGGKRQERYCPNCQKFWDTRIEVSGLPQTSTRIPHVPDQSDFIRAWHDWHRGYTILTNPDGSEQHLELEGEPLSQVAIGRLPRTQERIRAHPQLVARFIHGRFGGRFRLRSPPTLSNNSASSSNIQHNSSSHNIDEDVTGSPVTASQPTVTPPIDAENEFFNYSSISGPSWNSGTAGGIGDHDRQYMHNTRAAYQDSLRYLQQENPELGAQFNELIPTSPRHRNPSHASNLTRQINGTRRQLSARTARRRQNPIPVQNSFAAHTMNTPASNGGRSTPLHYFAGPNQTFTQQEATAEGLRQRVDDLRRELASLRAAPGDPGNFNASRAYSARLNRIISQLRLAEHQLNHGGELTNPFESPEEAVRQGAALQSWRSSLFRDQAPSHTYAPGTLNRTAETTAAANRQMQESNASMGTTPHTPRGETSSGESGEVHRQPSAEETSRPSVEAQIESILRRPIQSESPPDFWRPPGQRQRPSSAGGIIDESDQSPGIWTRARPRGSQHPSDTPSYFAPHTSLELLSPQGDPTGSGRGYRSGYRTLSGHRLAAPSTPGAADTTASNPWMAPRYLGASTPAQSQPPFEQMTPEQAASTSRYPELSQNMMFHEAQRVAQARAGFLEAQRRAQRVQRPQASLDNDATRPEPIAEEAKMVKMECKICFAQVSNHVVLPCGE